MTEAVDKLNDAPALCQKIVLGHPILSKGNQITLFTFTKNSILNIDHDIMSCNDKCFISLCCF